MADPKPNRALLDPRINCAPEGFDPRKDLPAGFWEFLLPFHKQFTPWQQELIEQRRAALGAAHDGLLPNHLPISEPDTGNWHIELPAWCADQRNQMTGPADDAELVVKMLNSGAPGVMLDLEDSIANYWPNLLQGIGNCLKALQGLLSYRDSKRNQTVAINDRAATVISVRPRGLHLNQAGLLDEKSELMSASLFDVAMITYQIEPSRLKHPLSFYIPKSESAKEAVWWCELFRTLAQAKGLPPDYIKCMALVESHP
ncbi:MAG TPA: hypothetical protein VNS63_14030, partial [Blastocatellia bacterium]|nr:hypothetical protein [Blastocatellia bacterium]